jgi:hypothetical protein
MMAEGVVALCSASSSTLMFAIAWFAGEDSPSRAKVETEPTNWMRALPAMVVQKVLRRKGDEESRC